MLISNLINKYNSLTLTPNILLVYILHSYKRYVTILQSRGTKTEWTIHQTNFSRVAKNGLALEKMMF